MSLSLGEKLRQAREERGISISEVAEQTRISSLYLKSIEIDDYRPLPGGIFNKGFVRSYARYVGFDEDEALRDYAELVSGTENDADVELKVYRPEVLTDDSSVRMMVPSIIFAIVILALMTVGIIFLVKYLTNQGGATVIGSNTPTGANIPANSNSAVGANIAVAPPASDSIVVELKAVSEPVWISYSLDGSSKEKTLAADESAKFDASDAFKANYAKVKANSLQVTINGKRISTPADGFEVNKNNVSQIVQSGEFRPEPGRATETRVTQKPPKKPPEPVPTIAPPETERPRTVPSQRRTPD